MRRNRTDTNKHYKFGKAARFILVMIFALCYFVFIVFFEARGRSPFSGSSSYFSEPFEAIPPYLHLFVQLEPPTSVSEPTARVKLIGIEYWTMRQEEFNLDKLCFQTFFLGESYSHGHLMFVEDMLRSADKPVCLSLRVASEGELTINGARTVIYISDDLEPGIRTTYAFRKEAQTFWYLPVILIGLVVLLGFLATINSINTFLQVSIAILFGIFGLRQILVPSDIGGPTILDALVLGLYLIFALILISFSIRTLLGQNDGSSTEPATAHVLTEPNHVKPNTNIRKSASESKNSLSLLIVVSLSALFGWALAKLKHRS